MTEPDPPRTREQLTALATPFPPKYVHGNPSGGGTYVKHHVVVQRLLYVLGPFDFELVEILRGYVPAIPPNPKAESARGREGRPALDHAVVGAICRLTCEIDGRRTVIEEIGEVEEPHNWRHDGARMKDAMSDAIKRCAARVSVGLHLWSQDEYALPAWLAAEATKSEGASGNGTTGSVVEPGAPEELAVAP